MCGIFGHTFVPQSSLPQAHAALHTLAHRGPDGWSHIHTNHVYMGHQRLSILDLSANGTQPMHAGGVYLTVNGEIYDFQTLRTELETTHNVAFTSHSDSEVLLHGYIHWGLEKLLERIDGMYAMAIYDTNTQQVHLARDHAGIKPLYYSLFEGENGKQNLGWASELQALAHWHKPHGLAINHTAVYDFLTYLYVPAPKSLYHNIFKLEAAHALTFHIPTSSITHHRHWQLQTPRDITNLTTAQTMVREAIQTSVAEQMVADVPVGTFLSGGVDSSIVSYEAAHLKPSLITCSIGFADPAVDETPYATMVAKHLQTNHKTQTVSQNLANENLELLRTLFHEPFGDTSAFPTYQVSALAKQHLTVVLTGDGGDELFGGYGHYTNPIMALTPWLGFLFPFKGLVAYLKAKTQPETRLHNLLRKLEIFTLLNPLERQVRLRGGLLHSHPTKRAFRKAFNIPETYDDLWHLRRHYRPDLPLKSRAMYLDFHTSMVDDILTKVDRTSMAVAIETRVPLLSKRMCQTAWRLSEKLLFPNGQLKGFLKNLYASKLPHACLYRPKQGFALGKTAPTDKLALHGKPLPEVLLAQLFPHLSPPQNPS